ncbi:kinase-like protein [Rhizopogon salebrosus TDB-379]|nr:kinase-like protein [Rhizopogon salebrosus TDB-379]
MSPLHFLTLVWKSLTTIGVKKYDYACSIPNLTRKIRKENWSSSGRSADVYKAVYSARATSQQVAVRSFRIAIPNNAQRSERQKLLVQADAWTTLQHKNILTPIGYVDGFGPLPSMVYKWMPRGTLTTYLQDHPRLSISRRLCLIEQIAAGLSHLHYMNVIHGNLYGNNILIDAEGVPHLADYELNGAYQGQHLPETVRWTAPERFGSHGVGAIPYSPTTQSDVYSVGGVVYQILTGRPPYYEKSRSKVPIEILNGNRPSRPPGNIIDDGYWELIQKCWSLPEDRPSATQVLLFAQTARLANSLG